MFKLGYLMFFLHFSEKLYLFHINPCAACSARFQFRNVLYYIQSYVMRLNKSTFKECLLAFLDSSISPMKYLHAFLNYTDLKHETRRGSTQGYKNLFIMRIRKGTYLANCKYNRTP